MSRRRLYNIHKWLGLVCGIFLLVISLSGIVLVFRKPIDRITRPAAFRLQAGRSTVAWGSLVASAESRYPGFRPVALALDAPPDEPIALNMKDPAGPLTVFLDPYSGHVVGDDRSNPPLSTYAYTLHTSLFLGRSGSIFTTLLGVALVLLAITGLFIYRHVWRRLLFLRLHRHRIILFSDLHLLTGLWSLLFLLLVGITGAWLNHDSLLPAEDSNDARCTSVSSFKSFDLLVNKARLQLPGFHPVSLVFPEDGTPDITIYGSLDGRLLQFFYGYYASSVKLDASTGAILEVSTPRSQTLIDKLSNLVYPLHSGDYALGPWIWIVRSLYSLAAAAPPILAVTGLILWMIRRRSSTG